MGLGQVPVALIRGFIEKPAVVNAEGDFLQSVNEVQVHRRVVNRVATQDDEELYPPLLHVLHEFP